MADRPSTFPRKLSETGLFISTADQKPAPGVLSYAINAQLWTDYAQSARWVAFPENSSAQLTNDGRWQFPANAVLAKTISLGGQRLETQLLHFDGEDWQPYTYAWRADQTDADLVPADGAEKEVSMGGQKVVWPLFSRSQCRLCHSSWSEYALAFQPEQLNRTNSCRPSPMAVRSLAYGFAGAVDAVCGPGTGPTAVTIGGGAAVDPP